MEIKSFLMGMLSVILIILLTTGFFVASKLREDRSKTTITTAKFSHIDDRNTTIYLPEIIFHTCNFGSPHCSFSYIDKNGNELYSKNFTNEDSTQFQYCECDFDYFSFKTQLKNWLVFNVDKYN